MAGLASYDADLLAALEALSPNTEAKFDFEVRDILDLPSCTPEALKKLSGHPDAPVAFGAYATLLALAWRNLDYDTYRRLVREAPQRVRDDPLYAALEAQAAGTSGGLPDLRYGLGRAEVAVDAAPDRPGVLHTLAEVSADLGDRDAASQTQLEAGLHAVERAIEVRRDDPYAKYHATRARLLAHLDRWDEADAEIALAIERERSGERHYVLRIGNYQNLRLSMLFDRRAEELRRRQESAQSEFSAVQEQVRELQGLRGQFLELLGLLAAVVAFVAAGIQVADAMSLRDGVALMAAIAGGILAAFAGFNLMFFPERSAKRPTIVLILGLAIIAGVWCADRFG